MPDDLDSQAIARRTFDVARRGYEQQDVRAFLHEVSSLVDRLKREAQELRERADRAEARLGLSEAPDEAMLMEVLGEETTRVLTSARDAAAEIRGKADAAAERIVADATSQAAEVRSEALQDADRRLADARAESDGVIEKARVELERRTSEADEAAARIRADASAEAQERRDEAQRELERVRAEAEAELETARSRGREMVAEAQAVRERVLRDLSSRRKRARQQVEKLNAGRERLLEAYAVVRTTVDDATSELHTALSDARMAADAAARRVDEEPELTPEELDAEIAAAALADHPIALADSHDELDLGDDSPGPFSGEVPVVDVPTVDVQPVTTAADPDLPDVGDTAEVVPGERRSRIGRRRKSSFEGLPPGELIRVEPPAADEGVRLLAEPAAAAEPEASAEGEVAPDVAADSEPEPVADSEPEPDADGDGESSVEDIFARLRGAGEEADPPADGAASAAEEPSSSDGEAFSERDRTLGPIDKELARRVKRTLADEQNEVLDLLRRAKPVGVSDLLPSADDHAARWAETASTSLSEAAEAGAVVSGTAAGSIADLADELARAFTAPLRDRIDRSFAASDGNLDDVADRVRALYREWKGTRLTDTCRHYTAAAYARGLFDGLADATPVRWVLDPKGGTCPDCDDNVLGGTLVKGEEFPTGHPCAPAHPGCRCLVVPAPA